MKYTCSEDTLMKLWLGRAYGDEIINFCSKHYSSRKAFVVIDANVHALHGEAVEKQLQRYFDTTTILKIPEGESSKSISQWRQLQDQLLTKGVERTTPIIAVGGGVTGDLGGFVAATALRGIPLVHLPTSLLAMVDSSIGGKTGINHQTGKNLIGAFYQPDAVFADTDFLQTLKRNEWVGGLAEMLKYAAIDSPAMFQELQKAIEKGFEPSEKWTELIRKSASVKAEVVQEDELESGTRAYLNFGHTFGHSLEKQSGYGNISHGQAVYVGMLAAVHYSNALGAPINKARFSPFNTLYPVRLPDHVTIQDLIEAMHYDKKVKNDVIRLVLLKEWGVPFVETGTDKSLLRESWQAAFEALKTN